MRVGEWRKAAPNKEAMSPQVLAILRPVLVDLGAAADAECWVVWGEDPESRYSVLAPTAAGLITVAMRLTGPDGPRATAKLIRWSKLSVSELGIESSGGHRLVAVQVESHVLKGLDTEADRICEFVRGLIAAMDGRHATMIPVAAIPAMAAGAGAAGAMSGADAVAAAAAMDEDEDAGAAKPAPKRPVEGAGQVAALGGNGQKPGPSAAKTAPKPAGAKPVSKPGDKPAGLALVPPAKPAASAGGSAGATPATAPGQPQPTPIAARAAAAHRPEPAAPGAHTPPAAPPPEPDRSEWIGPHPIEEPAVHESVKPRPWKP
jgi:hypothetical protein